MKGLIIWARITMFFGCLALLGVALSHLALTDISRGEANVSAEWTVVQLSAAIVVAFIISATLLLYRFQRKLST